MIKSTPRHRNMHVKSYVFRPNYVCYGIYQNYLFVTNELINLTFTFFSVFVWDKSTIIDFVMYSPKHLIMTFLVFN